MLICKVLISGLRLHNNLSNKKLQNLVVQIVRSGFATDRISVAINIKHNQKTSLVGTINEKEW